MAATIFNRDHIATTPDEKAIEKGFASSVGFFGGTVFALVACIVSGTAPVLFNPAVLLLFVTAIPLGIMAANRFLTSQAPDLPVLEMIRYSLVALPAVLVTEVALSGQALSLLGEFVGSAPMFGARMAAALIIAGAAHALARLTVWDAEDAAPAAQARPNVDWQSRYVEARTRLATTSIEVRRRREGEEAELAAFDRRLAALTGQTFTEAAVEAEDEWILEAAGETVPARS